MRRLLLLFLLAACGGPARRRAGLAGCGFERWEVKTASDDGARSIAPRPVPATIAALGALPGRFDEGERVPPLEVTTWQLTDVTLLQYRLESDGDYHLVLGDGRRTLIAEIPDPACVSKEAPLLPQIARAREQFEARHGPVPDLPAAAFETVTVVGVGFYDSPHEQTGAAPNQVELHPVLSICFGAGCAGPPPDAPAPARTGCASAGAGAWLAFLPLLYGRRAARRRARA